ncbi:MAG: MDR family MFS transporter [Candidatus Pacebacteria bacterium]|nr:MDR family MFS transporter [Candidatus Paceibacterota bacterium]
MDTTTKKINKPLILGGVILVMLLSALDQTIVATAMPKIVSEFNGLSHLSWVFTAYMLASTITVPIYGKLSDIFGRRGLYFLGIFIFLLGSGLCGFASSMLWLIVCRAIQGIGGGAMMVNSIAIIADVFPPAERAKWQGLMGGVFGLASIGGPLLGGWITDTFSWRWIFYINLPLGIIAIAVLAAALPKIKPDRSKRSIDYLGAALLTITLIPLLLALVWGGSQYPWKSWQIISLFTVAAVGCFGFVMRERVAKEPIISLSLFKNKVFLTSVIITFITTMGMFGAILYIPTFAQGVIGVTATYSGLILTPMMIAVIVTSAISGQIIARTGKYKTLGIIGMIIAIVGMWWFSTIGVDTTESMLGMRMVVLGIGLGITMPIFTIAVQSAFSKKRMGEVTAGTQLFRSIGGTVGTAIFGGVMNSQLASRLANINSDPFVKTMQSTMPNSPITNINPNTVQTLLTPEAQSQITAVFSKVPSYLQGQLSNSFNHFLGVIKLAFAQSVSHIFIIATILMAAALLIMFFMPQIAIRKGDHPEFEEIGIELEEELGQFDPEREPR